MPPFEKSNRHGAKIYLTTKPGYKKVGRTSLSADDKERYYDAKFKWKEDFQFSAIMDIERQDIGIQRRQRDRLDVRSAQMWVFVEFSGQF